MDKIIDIMNGYMQKMYLSRNDICHKIGAFFYKFTGFIYKLIHNPSKEDMKKIIIDCKGECSNEQLEKYYKDLRKAWFKYGIAADEYFVYEFENISDEKKKTFISDVDRLIYATILNERPLRKLFNHKWDTYVKYQQFYKREVVNNKTIDRSFFERNSRFMFKLENASRGKGAQILSVEDYDSIEEMIEAIPDWENGICEQLIEQDPWAAAWHEQSVNTMRAHTIRKQNGEIALFTTFIKMGQGDAIVDNGGVGGILANVNEETGVIETDGIDEKGNIYIVHPDSKLPIKGAVVPRWDEFRQFVQEIASVTPTVGFTGWDIALTKNGWVMVEGNAFGQMVGQQMPKRKGIKADILKLMRE